MTIRFVTIRSFVVALLAVISLACIGGDGDARTPPLSPVATSPPTSTVTPKPAQTLEEEVLEGYELYWEAYSLALLDLDPAHAEPVAAGEELERIGREVERLRAQGVAMRVVIKHSPVVVEAAEESAVIFDEMVNNSFYVDARTKEPPVASGSGEMLRDFFNLERANGEWKVVRRTRQR